jgi:hypothetical protein
MANFRRSKNLAHEIGLYRIALVVDALHEQTKTRPEFARLFNLAEPTATKSPHHVLLVGGPSSPWRKRALSNGGVYSEDSGDSAGI